MRNAHHTRIREALWRLTAEPPPSARVLDDESPLFLKAPFIVLLWTVTVVLLVGLLALGRMRVPRVVRGAAVAVRTATDSVALLLFLPASAARYVRVGQHIALETGDGPAMVDVTGVDGDLLDAAGARQRYPHQPSVLAQLSDKRLVVRVSLCRLDHCLTPQPGDVYAATASLGSRPLATYAMSGS
jgi:hypothetical protein